MTPKELVNGLPVGSAELGVVVLWPKSGPETPVPKLKAPLEEIRTLLSV